MAETHTNTDGANVHDSLVEAGDSTKAKVANAEQEMLLQYVLGLDLRDVSRQGAAPDARVIAEKVLQSVAGRLDNTRTQIDQAGLRGVLEQNISSALRGVTAHSNASRNNADQLGLQRIRAIAEGIYASLPKNMVDEMMRFSMPVALQVGTTLNKHKLFLGAVRSDINGGLAMATLGDQVVIDTRHTFWVENGPFANEDDLAKALTGKKFTYCGVELSRTQANPSAQISEPLAQAIARSQLQMIRLSNKYETRLEQVTINGQASNFSIDLNALVAAEIQPRGRYRYVGELPLADLQDWFNNVENMRRFTTGLESIDAVAFGTHVSITDTSGGRVPMQINQLLAYVVFERVRGINRMPPGTPPRAAGQLAVENISVFRVQHELQEQHQYHRKLREGSDNSAGAAMAASILMRYKDIGDALGTPDRAKTLESKNKAAAQRDLALTVEKIEATVMPISSDAWDEIALKLTDIRTKMGTVAAGSTVDIGSGAGMESYTVGSTAKDVEAVRAILRERRSELIAEQRKYAALGRECINARNQLGTTTPPGELTALFSGTSLDESKFTTSLDVVDLANKIKTAASLKSKQECEEELKKADEKLKDIDSGKTKGLTGAAAQHAVIAKYFESYHNCTAEEAKQAANYVLARTKIDTEVTGAMHEIVDETFEDDRWEITKARDDMHSLLTNGNLFGAEQHARHVVHGIASAIKAPIAGGMPRWSGANYRQLVTAYFSLKKLHDDAGVPSHIKLHKTGVAQAEMREIAKQLMQRHAVQVLREAGMTDADAKEAAKDTKKVDVQERVRQFLEGDPPKSFDKRIADAITHADKNVEWVRRGLAWAPKKVLGAGYNATKWTAKKGWDGTKWTAGKGVQAAKFAAITAPVEVVKTVTYRAPVAAGKTVWNNKFTLAAGTVGAVVGGPIGALALGYAAKKMFESNHSTAA